MRLSRTKRGRSTTKPTYTAHYSDGNIQKNTPVHPLKSYETEKSKKNRALFVVVMEVIRQHQWFLKTSFDPVAHGTNTLKFYSMNKEALRECFGDIADRLAAGEDVDIEEAEATLVAYAQSHPQSIVIGHREGFRDLYLDGPWPETAVMVSLDGHEEKVIRYRKAVQ